MRTNQNSHRIGISIVLILLAMGMVAGILFTIPNLSTASAVTPTYVQGATNQFSSSTTVTCTLSSAIAVGSVIAAFVTQGTNTGYTATIADTASNSWTAGPTITYSTTLKEYSFYVLDSKSEASDVITFTISTAASGGATCEEITLGSSVTSFALDTDSTGSQASSGTISVTSYSPKACDLIVAAAAVDTGGSGYTYTAGATYTLGATMSSGGSTGVMADEYKLCSLTTETSPITSNNGFNTEISLAFKYSVAVTLTLDAATGSNAISGSNYFVVTYTYGGTGGLTQNAVGTTTNLVVDPDTTVSISALSSGSGTSEQWCLQATGGVCSIASFNSGLSTTASATYYYYDLLLQPVSASITYTVAPGTYPSFTYSTAPTSGGSSDAPLSQTVAFTNSLSGYWMLRGTFFLPQAGDTASGTSVTQWSDVGLTYGLNGYWPLDEGTGTSAYDLSGNSNTGTLTSSPTWESGATCKFGDCLLFSGSNYVTIPTSASLTPETGASGAITVSAWVYPVGISYGSCPCTIADKWGASNEEYDLFVTTSGILTFWIDNGVSTNECAVTSDTSLTLGEWNYVAGTFSATATDCSVYINGVGWTGSSTGTVSAGTAAFRIGYLSTGGQGWIGYIDDVRVYGIALTNTAIIEQYDLTSAVTESQVVTPGATSTISYYEQLSTTFGYSVSGGSPPAPYVSLTSLSTALSIQLKATSGNILWIDAGKTWTMTNPIVSGGDRWTAATGTSGVAGTGKSPAYSVEYGFTISYGIVGGGLFNAPIFEYVSGGQSLYIYLTSTPQTVYPTSSTAWNVTNPLIANETSTISSLERGYTTQGTSGTISGANTIVFLYYHQFYVPFSYEVLPSGTSYSGNPYVKYYQGGAVDQTTLSKTTNTSIWIDAGTNWSAESPFDTTYIAQTKGGIVQSTGSISNSNLVEIYYYASPTCSGTNTLTLAENGCYAGAVYFTYANLIGSWFAAILLLILALGVYFKTDNGMLAVFVFFVGSLIVGILLPPIFGTMIAFALASLLTYMIYEFVRSRNS